jgi:alpha-tubulin suppressor-like RCC1 family protein
MCGGNQNGGIGNNTNTGTGNVPVNISTYGSIVSKSIKSISCGMLHTAALDSTGSVHTWGYNYYGQLGNNSTTDSLVPVNVSTFGSLNSRTLNSVACGMGHTIALDTSGSVHAWGINGANQLGDGTTNQSRIPIRISAFGSLVSKTITSIACGEYHAMAIDTTGTLHAWGNNDFAQLGNNGTFTTIPVQISSFGSLVSKTITFIACGKSHNIAIDTTGSLHAWGWNGYGQLGNNTASSTVMGVIPVQISTFGSLVSKTIAYAACGYAHSLALDTTGYVHTWGQNQNSQLGNNSYTDSYIPINISTFGSLVSKTIVSISCGSAHSLALDTTGAIHTWGSGGGNYSMIPILITNSTSFTNFTGQHRCFVASYSNNLSAIEGLIVCANQNSYTTTSVPLGGDAAFTVGLSAITINDALPLVSLAQKENDPTVFGVVSLTPNISPGTPEFNHVELAKVGDLRAEINAVGEGAMWVSNISGPFESGDYITSSSLPGYGKVQNDDFLHNYTVAKTTMSCDFDTSKTQPKLQRRTDSSGNNVLSEDGLPIFDPVLDASSNVILEPLFLSRSIDSSGNQIGPDESARLLSLGSNVYLAAFVGVTYHCG